MLIWILFPLETDLIHVRLEFAGYVWGKFGEESVPVHVVTATGSAANKKKNQPLYACFTRGQTSRDDFRFISWDFIHNELGT